MQLSVGTAVHNTGPKYNTGTKWVPSHIRTLEANFIKHI